MDDSAASDLDLVARSLVENCVRNTNVLESLHSGIFPASQTGDFADVKVVSPYGEIPWNQLSRLSDDEMRALMKEVVNKVYTWLQHTEHLSRVQGAHRWDKAELDPDFMAVVAKKNRLEADTVDGDV